MDRNFTGDIMQALSLIHILAKRVAHGIFGYSFVPDSYYEAVMDWEKDHHGYQPVSYTHLDVYKRQGGGCGGAGPGGHGPARRRGLRGL